MGRQKEFMQDQIKEIEKHLKKEREAGNHVNDDTIHKWIEEESESFRARWEKDHT